jgi:hypothetical protein
LDSRNATLLKYRFGDLPQMTNHLHVVEARTLLFYRDGRTRFGGGQRVVVELSLSNSEQAVTLRGSVVALTDAYGTDGVWIEFPDSRLAKRLSSGGAAAITLRRQRRVGCDLMVELRYETMPLLGRMVDVSLAGARIVGPSGLARNADVELRIMGAQPPLPAQLGRVQVARSESGGDVGVRFLRTDPTARVAAGKLLQAVQEAWAKAPELIHSALCCKGGHNLDPPLPRLRSTRT